ncbi:type II secretion system protein N [Comamonadaceae bacterium PP-2]
MAPRSRSSALAASKTARVGRTRGMRIWPYAATGLVVGGLITLVSQFPAAWAAQWITSGTDGRVKLLDARGTIWRGSAVLGVGGGAGSRDARMLPGRLSWNLQTALWPDSYRPALRLGLDHACCLQRPAEVLLRPAWGGGAFTLKNLDLHVPASVLEGLGTPWNTMALDGALSLTVAQWGGIFSEGRFAQQGKARLQLTSLTSRVTTVKPVGSYLVTFDAGDSERTGPLRFTLETLQGALQLSGQGELAGNGWRFNGEAGTEPRHRAALANVLNLIGTRNGPIIFRIRP